MPSAKALTHGPNDGSIKLASPRGSSKKTARPITNATAVVPQASGPLNSTPTSPAEMLADYISARMPRPSDSHNIASPRKNGVREIVPLYSEALTGSV